MCSLSYEVFGSGVVTRVIRGSLTGLLLAGHGALGTLAGARVGLRALAAHGRAAAVRETLVRADLDLAPDVRGDLAAEVALDPQVVLDPVAQLDEVVVDEVLDAGVR